MRRELVQQALLPDAVELNLWHLHKMRQFKSKIQILDIVTIFPSPELAFLLDRTCHHVTIIGCCDYFAQIQSHNIKYLL